ncbi:MAG: ABC transporter ATP-binding protein [Nitrospirae bacterium]|nr:ABC transporter ATP-binding protein [Nitrospirota bacterium]
MTRPLLEVQSLSFRYQGDWVLREVTFQVPRGTIWGIVGPNGSGKTTLLKLLAGLLSPQKGTVRLEGEDLREMSPISLARRLGVVFQENFQDFPLRVYDMVALGRSPHLSGLGFLNSDDQEIVGRAIRDMGVEDLRSQSISAISGGERQRVLIARTLAQQAEILLLDEPTTHLDIGHQFEMQQYLLDLLRQREMTLVVVSHDLNMVSSFCDGLLLLHQGRVVGCGSPGDVLTERIVRELYDCPVRVDRDPLTGVPRFTIPEREP